MFLRFTLFRATRVPVTKAVVDTRVSTKTVPRVFFGLEAAPAQLGFVLLAARVIARFKQRRNNVALAAVRIGLPTCALCARMSCFTLALWRCALKRWCRLCDFEPQRLIHSYSQ